MTFTAQDREVARVLRSDILDIELPATSRIDSGAIVRSARQRRHVVAAGASALVLVGSAVGGVIVMGSGPVTSTRIAASTTPAADWRQWVLAEPDVESTPPPLTIQTAEAIGGIFASRALEDDWAAYHYDDDGTVVVNVKRGHETSLAAELAQVEALELGPVRIRLVEHSTEDLLAPTRGRPGAQEFGDAVQTGSSISPEHNALVINITEVGPDEVAAVHATYGPTTYVQLRPPVTLYTP